MKFKNARQHKSRPKPEFREIRDRFDNLTLVATWQGREVRMNHVSELSLDKARKQLTKQLHHG